MTKGTSIGTSVRGPSTEALLWQGSVAKGRESVPLTGLWSGSRPGLARHPRLQVVLRQGRVTKGTSIGTSPQGPSTEALLWQGSVAKGRESVPLKGLRSSLRPGLARHPRLQIVLRYPRVAKHLPTNLKPVSRQRSMPVLGTETPPKSTSEASQCGEEGLPTYPSARGPSTESPQRWLCAAKEPFLE